MGGTKTNSNIQKKKMLEALEISLGVVTQAAKKVGINRGLHYRWMTEDPEYKNAVDSVEGVAIDFAESQLYKQIQGGNPASTIFYLKTKGRKRGYNENVDVNLSGGVNLTIEYVGNNKDNNSGSED